MKRIISMILVLLMLGSMLVACANTTTPGNTPSGSQGGSKDSGDVSDKKPTGEVSTGEGGEILDRIPEGTDYDGQTVNLLGWSETKNTTMPEDAGSGDPVQEQAYYHLKAVQDRLNFSFNTTYVNAAWSAQGTFMTAARAEDGAYDLIVTYSLWPPVLAQEGRLANLDALAYPDFEMPWWPESTTNWYQSGALYFIAGNSSVQTLWAMETMFVNLAMFEEEGLGDPVKTVNRGTWTVEELAYCVKQFAGMAEANPGEIYGLYLDDFSRADMFYYAAFDNTRTNANGVVEFAFDNADTLQEISDYADIYVDIFKGVETGIGADNHGPMYNGQTAVMAGNMSAIRGLEDTLAYAAIPLPKRDADQDNYRMICNNGFALYCVPISTLDKEMSGVIIEAIASSEYRTIGPFVFEQYLKRRYSSDADGMKCFDIIRGALLYDFGRVHQVPLGVALEGWWRACIQNATNSFVSSYQGNIGALRTSLATILADYEKFNSQ